MHAEEKLAALGLAIPNVPKSVANYVPWKKAGSILYLAGAVPRMNGVHTFLGKVDRECSVEDGYKAARNCILNHFAMIQDALGTLDRVDEVLQVVGYVNSSPDFRRQPEVVNGASDLLVEIFGDRGRHTRLALGIFEIANNVPVEVQLVVSFKS
jgi:enamine deaminase RidA (YjgF/YER057c/UK114 family)